MSQEELGMLILFGILVYLLIGWGVGLGLNKFDDYPCICLVLWPVMVIIRIVAEFICLMRDTIRDIRKGWFK